MKTIMSSKILGNALKDLLMLVVKQFKVNENEIVFYCKNFEVSINCETKFNPDNERMSGYIDFDKNQWCRLLDVLNIIEEQPITLSFSGDWIGLHCEI